MQNNYFQYQTLPIVKLLPPFITFYVKLKILKIFRLRDERCKIVMNGEFNNFQNQKPTQY